MKFKLRLGREASTVFLWLFLALFIGCLQVWAGCDEAPAGQAFRIRLSQPISSYSTKRGSPVRAIIVESPSCNGVPLFPLGTEVEGRVKSVQKVGMGFRHEAAALDLEFDWIFPDDGTSIQMGSRVVEVDNAREKIKKGVIHGVRASDALQGQTLFRVAHFPIWNPYSYWVSAFSESVFPISPEPEINFPAGTELRLELTAPLLTTGATPPPAAQEFDELQKAALDEKVGSFAERTYNTKGKQADVVNLLFLGTPEQVHEAFLAAGWNTSDPLSTKAVLREFHAILSMNNYPHLPMANHLLDGQPSSASLEKSFDSYAKRDHLRIWGEPERWEGQSVWLSAATAETGASWSIRTRRFVHEVQPDLDLEREKVVRDLTIAGCVDAVYSAPRPAMHHELVGSTGMGMQTDGAVAVIRLKHCRSLVPADALVSAPIATRPHSKFERLVRTQVLSARNIWRDNIVYDAFDLSRAGIRAMDKNHKRDQQEVPEQAPATLQVQAQAQGQVAAPAQADLQSQPSATPLSAPQP